MRKLDDAYIGFGLLWLVFGMAVHVGANEWAVQGDAQAVGDRSVQDGSREARAYALGNRGPIRTGADGKLLPEILESYWTNGFYVFQGVVGPEELA